MGGLARGRADRDIDHITGYSLWCTSYEWLHSRDLLFLLAASWLPHLWFQDGFSSCAASHSYNTQHGRICTSLLIASTTGPCSSLAKILAKGGPELNRAVGGAIPVSSAQWWRRAGL